MVLGLESQLECWIECVRQWFRIPFVHVPSRHYWWWWWWCLGRYCWVLIGVNGCGHRIEDRWMVVCDVDVYVGAGEWSWS